LLTCTSPETGKATHGAFTDIFAKHSYKQHLMAGANTEGSWYLAPFIAKTLNKHVPLHSRPASALEYARNITTLLGQSKSPQFVLIEDGAGHMPYKSQHNTFGQANDIDKYDNCILDADARLTAIIQALQSYDAILLFTSDHGESFGEEGRFGHAGPMTAMEQRRVFSFIWYSDSYAEKRPEIIKALKDNALRFTSHDYVYHTIISVAGIHSDIQIPAQDMTRAQ
jgi:arylsulfatase A-like enzyme